MTCVTGKYKGRCDDFVVYDYVERFQSKKKKLDHSTELFLLKCISGLRWAV